MRFIAILIDCMHSKAHIFQIKIGLAVVKSLLVKMFIHVFRTEIDAMLKTFQSKVLII